jgi:hypothetical protein
MEFAENQYSQLEAVFSSSFWKTRRQDPNGPSRPRAGPAGSCRKNFYFFEITA